MAVSLSALSVGRYLHPWKIPGAHCSFLLEAGLEVLGKLENVVTFLRREAFPHGNMDL
jgi:hypothetical protein